VRAFLRRSSDEFEDGLAHGRPILVEGLVKESGATLIGRGHAPTAQRGRDLLHWNDGR
jgi:hypothetical protein